MLKTLIVMALVSTATFAQEVRIYSSGTYTVAKGSVINGDKIDFARKQALIIAKQNAIEEAGTAIYSSIQIDSKNGKEKIITKLEAIASGIIKTKILQGSFAHDKYFISIEATVDTADVESVYKKADKKMNDIHRLQEENNKISEQLKDIAAKLFKAIKNNGSTVISRPEEIFEKQEQLVAEYESNAHKIKVNFEKGTLAELATNNTIKANNAFERNKQEFDKEVTKVYIKSFRYRLQNVKPAKKGKLADIDFWLFTKNEGNIRGLGGNIRFSEFFSHRGYYNSRNNYSRYTLDWIHFKENKEADVMYDWIAKNRNMAMRVNIGEWSFITERIVKSDSDCSLRTRGIFNTVNQNFGYTAKRCLDYLNNSFVLTHRRIENIPMSILEQADNMSVELVMVSEDDYYNSSSGEVYKADKKNNVYPLKNLGEASNY